MNPEEQALLEQLKDVALPVAPGWWPPAPGWWLVLAALLISGALALRVLLSFLKKREQDTWRNTALAEHRRIRDDFFNNKNPNTALAELSVLMRRVSLAVQARRSVASLTDDQWLQSLDVTGETTEYSRGAGRVLYRHQYQRELQLDDVAMSELFELTGNTIKKAGCNNSRQQEGADVAAL